MNTSEDSQDPILEVAWTRYAEFDLAAKSRSKIQKTFHRWVGIIGVLAVFFAILSAILPTNLIPAIIVAIKIVFVLLPITASILANVGNQFFSGADGLVLRAGAEQIHREIYQYRTILQDSPDRKSWLENRLREILREVHRSLNGELSLEAYSGELPPPYSVGNVRKDKGFADLNAQAYFTLRTKDQLDWHINRRNRLHTERVRLQVYIFIAGALGTVIASLSAAFLKSNIGLWVALFTAISTALVSWKELRNLDMTIRNFSKVTLELGFISDHWKNLTAAEKTQAEFFNMVKDTESVLWNQNIEYIKSMQEALETSKQTQANLIDQAMQHSRQAVSQLNEDSTAETMLAYVPQPPPVYHPNQPIAANLAGQPVQPYQGELGAPDFNPMSTNLIPEGAFDDPTEHLNFGMAGLVPEGSFDEAPASMGGAPVPEGTFSPENSTPPSSGGVGD